jgi:Tol biopolymer transport system component
VRAAGWIGLAGLLALGAPGAPGGSATARPPIVFTQVASNAKAAAGAALVGPFLGARIASLSPTGAVKVLTAGFNSAADPDVSWDGKKILFAGRKTAAELWQVYEMNSDGSGARQIVTVPFHCRQPVYQSMIFYLDDPGPVPQISFVGSPGLESEGDLGAAWNLYSVRFDGSGLRQLTYNPGQDLDPVMNEDGRLLYSSVQRHSLAWGRSGRTALFGVNLDGSDGALFSGDEGRQFKRMPAVTPSRHVVFVESDKPAPDGAGNLASVSLRRNLHSYKALTRPADGLFLTPSLLGEDDVLVSRRAAADTGLFAICRFDLKTNLSVQLYADPQHNAVQARMLAAHPMPVGRSSVVDEKEPTGKLFNLSVFTTDLPKSDGYDGKLVKRVRILEGIARRAGAAAPAGDRSPYLVKRVLGEFDIEADGSFHAQIPANIPVQIQTLDANGLALRTCAWIWVKNKAKRGCIGCHEDGELSPENVFSDAVGKPPHDLNFPTAQRREVRFEKDVQPILQNKCMSGGCHAGPPAPSFRYEDLLAKGYVDPNAARLSPLVWYIHGRVTTQPWDKVSGTSPLKKINPDAGARLTSEEKRTIVEWIDTGAHR